jgi:hypothetical protein
MRENEWMEKLDEVRETERERGVCVFLGSVKACCLCSCTNTCIRLLLLLLSLSLLLSSSSLSLCLFLYCDEYITVNCIVFMFERCKCDSCSNYLMRSFSGITFRKVAQ